MKKVKFDDVLIYCVMSLSPKSRPPKSILVVCLGNICRSPVGEYLLRYYSKQSSVPEVREIIVDSAGISPVFKQMSAHSAHYLELMGINSAEFQSKRITRELIKNHELILVMEENQKVDIKDLLDPAENGNNNSLNFLKVMTFAEAAGFEGDVEDPYGASWEVYRNVLDQIHHYAKKMIEIWEKNHSG